MSSITTNKCQRENIEGIISSADHWSVDDDGHVVALISEGEAGRQPDEYICHHCDQYFDSWSNALAHLPKDEAAAGRTDEQ